MVRKFLPISSFVVTAMMFAAPVFSACLDEGNADNWGIDPATNTGCWINGVPDLDLCINKGKGVGIRPDSGENCLLNTARANAVSSPGITNIKNGDTIGTTQTIAFSAHGKPTRNWWILIGSSKDGKDIYDSGKITPESEQHTVYDLPAGKTVHITLYHITPDKKWVPTHYTASVSADGTSSLPTITNFSEGSTISQNQVVKFTSNGGIVQKWVLRAGSTLDDNDYYDSGTLPASTTQHTLLGLPPGKSVHLSVHYYSEQGNWISSYYTANVAPEKNEPDSPPTTTLTASGPIDVETDGSTIENLDIPSDDHDKCGIRIVERKNITVRNININHAGAGICVVRSENVKIQTVRLVNTIDRAGPHCRPGLTVDQCKRTSRNKNPEKLYPADSHNNITIRHSSAVSVDTAYLEKGEAGIIAYRTPGVSINNIHCKDIRGPYWRGQCVQFQESDNGKLTNFYIQQFLSTSSGHDNVNAFKSENVLVSDGLVDGNWSRNGVGVIADNDSHNMTVKNVDFTHQGVAAVNAWSGPTGDDNGTVPHNFTAENIRVKDGHCDTTWHNIPDFGPSSGGLAFAKHPASKNAKFINSQYWNHCRSEASYFGKLKPSIREIKEAEFTLKEPPISITFPWLR